MYILYSGVSHKSRTFFIKLPQANSGGPVTNFPCQVKFAPNSQNLPKLSRGSHGLPQLSTIIHDPAQTSKLTFWYNCPKLYLTSSAYYCIIGAAKDYTNLGKLSRTLFAPLVKKVVDLLLAPPRQISEKKTNPFGVFHA